MLVVNVALAFAVGVVVWYAASRGLAQVIFAAETRNPSLARRPLWGAFEHAATLAVFAVSVGVWIGLTYLLERIDR
jgi:hypothetical protein